MPTTNMPSILDSREAIAKIDASNALGSIEGLADQVREAWTAVQQLDIPDFSYVNNVVVAAMGGSALGADVVKHLYKDSLTIPFEVVNSYDLPAYVDRNTLVILASYSGNTEETLAAAGAAQEKQAQIMVVAAGGKLAELAQEHKYPAYIIKALHNPSGQPRMAIGYALIGLIGLLAKAHLISLTDEEIQEVLTTVIRTTERNTVEVAQTENQAKLLAYTYLDRRPILVASEFLSGAVHVSTNQFNENAKTFADFKIIPEINHHLMEGLQFPASNEASHVFTFVQSDLYRPVIQKRLDLTKEVVEQNHIETVMLELESETKLTQVFELITLLSFTNFYLTMLEGIDPSPIPFVDWFKTSLSQ